MRWLQWDELVRAEKQDEFSFTWSESTVRSEDSVNAVSFITASQHELLQVGWNCQAHIGVLISCSIICQASGPVSALNSINTPIFPSATRTKRQKSELIIDKGVETDQSSCTPMMEQHRIMTAGCRVYSACINDAQPASRRARKERLIRARWKLAICEL